MTTPEEDVPETPYAEPPTNSDQKEHSKSDDGGWRDQQRHIFMLIASAIIVTIIGCLVYFQGGRLYVDVDRRLGAFVPYMSALAGVLLFILNTSRKKGKNWSLRNHWGEHCFRIAQAIAYLFIVQWAYANASGTKVTGGEFPPNVLGFLVGLFILRVERAMEGFGDRFEAILLSIFPRSVARPTPDDRRKANFKNRVTVENIAEQYKALRPQLEADANRGKFEQDLASAQKMLDSDDTDGLEEAVSQLAYNFDELRKSVGITLVPLEDLLEK